MSSPLDNISSLMLLKTNLERKLTAFSVSSILRSKGHQNWLALRQEWKKRPVDWLPKRRLNLDSQTVR